MGLTRRVLLLAAALAIMPATASAQITSIIAGLFGSVNSVSFSAGGGVLLGGGDVEGECGPGICVFQLEVLLDLPAPEGVTFELGLGTGVIRGFRLADPGIDFYGSSRALPSVAVYASANRVFGRSAFLPYGGLRVGFSQLWNARAYDAGGHAFSVSGEAFDFGAVAGLYLARTPLRGLYLEASLHHRQFDSLNWTFPGPPVLPAGWPRALDLSALEVVLGWQFRLTHAE